MIGYKVVRKMWGEFVSATILGWVLGYEIGKVTTPREGDGPLAIFETKEQALNFAGPTYVGLGREHQAAGQVLFGGDTK